MDPRCPEFNVAKGEARAWDSSEATRFTLKYVLPRDAGRDRTVWGAFGLRGEETKLLDVENERLGGLDGDGSTDKRGCSRWDDVGVRGG